MLTRGLIQKLTCKFPCGGHMYILFSNRRTKACPLRGGHGSVAKNSISGELQLKDRDRATTHSYHHPSFPPHGFHPFLAHPPSDFVLPQIHEFLRRQDLKRALSWNGVAIQHIRDCLQKSFNGSEGAVLQHPCRREGRARDRQTGQCASGTTYLHLREP